MQGDDGYTTPEEWLRATHPDLMARVDKMNRWRWLDTALPVAVILAVGAALIAIFTMLAATNGRSVVHLTNGNVVRCTDSDWWGWNNDHLSCYLDDGSRLQWPASQVQAVEVQS